VLPDLDWRDTPIGVHRQRGDREILAYCTEKNTGRTQSQVRFAEGHLHDNSKFGEYGTGQANSTTRTRKEDSVVPGGRQRSFR
jgi:hypothetical protein